jgi:hypothetical protein
MTFSQRLNAQMDADWQRREAVLATVKTCKQWDESGKSFTEFATPGDYVDESTVEYFRGVVPPAYSSGSMVQCGEAYSLDSEGYLYTTFTKRDNGLWRYEGHCHKADD